MDMATIISVHAQFPKNVMLNTELNLDPTNWEWKKTLAFPVNRLNNLQFSSKPYKWIRYATGIVIGARGELCMERDSPNPVPIDYESSLPALSIDLYYHTTDEERRHVFPIDPKLADTSTITSSLASTRRDNFRYDVEGRDGSCVLTGADALICDAAHLIPHSKGSAYIETFTTHRGRLSSGDDDLVHDINDVRNGLLIQASLHRVLGNHLAFLKTPNFAMDTSDVDPNADGSQERFTSHVFNQSLEGLFRSGAALRVPSDMSNWPPAALFDADYAGAVMHHFGIAVADILEKWKEVFYPGGPITAVHAGQFDVVMMYRFQAMEPENVKTYLKQFGEMVAASERKGLEEKVDSWRESLHL